MKNSKHLALILAIFFIAIVISVGYLLMGFIPALIFAVAFIGGFILWLLTTYQTQVDPLKLIIPYLLSIAFFIIHVYEEYLTDFEIAMTNITGFHIVERNFLTVAAFVGPLIWILGAVLLMKRWHLGYFFLSTFYVAMILAELSHFIFPFLEDGTFHYVSGMYTAALPLIPCVYGLTVTIREINNKSPKT